MILLSLYPSFARIEAAMNFDCQTPLLSKSSELVLKPSEQFIGYLGRLLETQVIGNPEIEKVVSEIERIGGISNPISEEAAALDYDQYIHRAGFQKLIDAGGIDQELLKTWLLRTLENRGVAKIEREETRIETEELHRKMIFHRIEPGEFFMGEGEDKFKVRITKPFEMMSTPVTQKMWALVMKNNPAFFGTGPNGLSLEIDGKPIQMQPDNPIERVTWYDVQRFIIKLNELSRRGDKSITKLIPDHKIGHVYRLPTEAEWEFVVRDRGTANGVYFFGDNPEDLLEHAWLWENSERRTQPVAGKKPLVIDGNDFFDLYGNVFEWTSDYYGTYRKRGVRELLQLVNGWLSWKLERPVLDPTGPKEGSSYVVRGGGWTESPARLKASFRYGEDPRAKGMDIGFRLVREVSPWK